MVEHWCRYGATLPLRLIRLIIRRIKRIAFFADFIGMVQSWWNGGATFCCVLLPQLAALYILSPFIMTMPEKKVSHYQGRFLYTFTKHATASFSLHPYFPFVWCLMPSCSASILIELQTTVVITFRRKYNYTSFHSTLFRLCWLAARRTQATQRP